MKKEAKKSVDVSDNDRREAVAAFHLIVRAVPAAHRRLAVLLIQKVQKALGDSTPVEKIGKVPPRSIASRLSAAEVDALLEESRESRN